MLMVPEAEMTGLTRGGTIFDASRHMHGVGSRSPICGRLRTLKLLHLRHHLSLTPEQVSHRVCNTHSGKSGLVRIGGHEDMPFRAHCLE